MVLLMKVRRICVTDTDFARHILNEYCLLTLFAIFFTCTTVIKTKTSHIPLPAMPSLRG